jgi:phage I-like protein
MCGVDKLVLLIRTAREDASVREPLRQLLALDDAGRIKAIERWVKEGVAAGQSVELLSAIAFLSDDDIARQARELLEPS